MNLILLQSSELNDDVITLERNDRRFQHLRKVLRTKTGDSLKIGLLQTEQNSSSAACIGSGEILSIDAQSARIRCAFSQPAPAKLPLSLCIALPRPNMVKRILKLAAETGVEALHFFHSHKVEQSYWSSDQLSEDKLEYALIEGLEQGRDVTPPSVHFYRSFEDFCTVIPKLSNARQAFIADWQDATPCPQPLNAPALLCIGPEGGFIGEEVKRLNSLGLQSVHFGPRVLKVENAVASAIARLYGPEFLL